MAHSSSLVRSLVSTSRRLAHPVSNLWTRSRAARLVETLARLDSAAIEDGTLCLGGWASTFGAGPVDGFEVTLAGANVSAIEVENGLPSPGMLEHHPYLDASAAAVADFGSGRDWSRRR